MSTNSSRLDCFAPPLAVSCGQTSAQRDLARGTPARSKYPMPLWPTSAKRAPWGSVHCDDHVAFRHARRAAKDLSATSLHALRCRVDIADVEIVKPKRNRHRRGLCGHSADRLPAGGEQLICARRASFGLRFLPAKKLAVERPRLLPVGGKEFVPADAPRRAQINGLLLSRWLSPLEQRKRCHLRVSDDRKAADVQDVLRLDVHGAAKVLDPVCGGVDVVDADISDPTRPLAHVSSRPSADPSAR